MIGYFSLRNLVTILRICCTLHVIEGVESVPVHSVEEEGLTGILLHVFSDVIGEELSLRLAGH